MSKSAFRSGRLAKAAFRAIICGLALAAVDGKAVRGQTGNDDRPFATKFFLDEPPNSNQLNIIPNAADLMVAKVRLIGRATYLIGRHQPLPKDLFYAKMDVLQVIRGDIKPGSRVHLYFGRPGQPRPGEPLYYKYPHTPAMLERNYYVVFQTDADDRRRLVAFRYRRRNMAIGILKSASTSACGACPVRVSRSDTSRSSRTARRPQARCRTSRR